MTQIIVSVALWIELTFALYIVKEIGLVWSDEVRMIEQFVDVASVEFAAFNDLRLGRV